MQNAQFTTSTGPRQAPADSGYLRIGQLEKLIPVRRETIHWWSRTGRFPAAIKLSDQVAVWRASEVHAWMAERGLELPLGE